MVLKYKMGIRYCGFNIKKGRGQSNYPFLMRMLITGEREIPPFLRSGSRDFEPLAVPVLGLVSNSRPQFVMFVVVFPQYTTKTSPSFSMGIVRRGKYTNAREKRHPRGDYEWFSLSARKLKARKEKTYVDRLTPGGENKLRIVGSINRVSLPVLITV